MSEPVPAFASRNPELLRVLIWVAPADAEIAAHLAARLEVERMQPLMAGPRPPANVADVADAVVFCLSRAALDTNGAPLPPLAEWIAASLAICDASLCLTVLHLDDCPLPATLAAVDVFVWPAPGSYARLMRRLWRRIHSLRVTAPAPVEPPPPPPAELRFPDLLTPELAEQGLLRRLGRGALRQVWPLASPLAVVVAGGGATLLDLQRETVLADIDFPADCGALSGDRQWLALAGPVGLRVWDLYDPAAGLALAANNAIVQHLAFNADGTLLAAAAGQAVCLWRLAAGGAASRLDTLTLPAPATRLAFSPDGSLLAAAAADHSLRLWRMLDRRLVRRWAPLSVESIAFTPEGDLLAVGGRDRQIRLLHVNDGRPAAIGVGHTGVVECLDCAASGLLASGGADHSVRLWQVAASPQVQVEPVDQHLLGVHAAGVADLRFTIDEVALVSGGRDNRVCLWRLADGLLQGATHAHNAPITGLDFHPAGTALATGASDGCITIWPFAAEDGPQRLADHLGRIATVAFAAGGQLLLATGADRTVQLRRANDGAAVWSQAAPGPVQAAVLAPDETMLALATDDRQVLLWQLTAGTDQALTVARSLSLSGHTNRVRCIAFRPDGSGLASGGDDGRVRLWRSSDGAAVGALRGHGDAVRSVAFGAHGQVLASAGDDTTIRLWNALSGAPIRVLQGHQAAVSDLAFAPDGKLLASASADRSVKIWDLASGALLATLSGHAGPVTRVVFAADSATLASGGDDGVVRLWRTPRV